MLKTKTIFRCQECGQEALKWVGQCPACSRWNSMVEETDAVIKSNHRAALIDFSSEALPLSKISEKGYDRIKTDISEFNRLLGGGLVPGQFILLGGPPGIGKSTLMLQISASLPGGSVLYVSGEESQDQVASRAKRLGLSGLDHILLLSETRLSKILDVCENRKSSCLVVDSIQTTYREDLTSAPGSVAQVRECAAELLRFAKGKNVITFVLGHVTKEGDIAGPRVLEHLVDSVLYFETERFQTYRMLRAHKNRFGPTNEIAVFEMREDGLKAVSNVSELFLTHRHRESPAGCAAVAAMEGTRPLCLEIQALVSKSHFSFPKRMSTGIDLNRLLMLVAVLSRRLSLNLEFQDVFVNAAGGLKIKEPSIDLGAALAIASALENFPLDAETLFVGEVGLSGEIRSVPLLRERLKEAGRMGFKKAFIPAHSKESLSLDGIEIETATHLREVYEGVRKSGK